jgi:hypothetical protein
MEEEQRLAGSPAALGADGDAPAGPRIYELARELGVRARRVEEELEAMGRPVRSFASRVSQGELRELLARLGPGAAAEGGPGRPEDPSVAAG